MSATEQTYADGLVAEIQRYTRELRKVAPAFGVRPLTGEDVREMANRLGCTVTEGELETAAAMPFPILDAPPGGNRTEIHVCAPLVESIVARYGAVQWLVRLRYRDASAAAAHGLAFVACGPPTQENAVPLWRASGILRVTDAAGVWGCACRAIDTLDAAPDVDAALAVLHSDAPLVEEPYFFHVLSHTARFHRAAGHADAPTVEQLDARLHRHWTGVRRVRQRSHAELRAIPWPCATCPASFVRRSMAQKRCPACIAAGTRKKRGAS